MRLFNSGAASSLMNRASVPDDTAIESKIVSRAIQSAQTQVEGRNAEIRKNVLKYDDVLNRQREAIYGDRRLILEGDDIATRIDSFLSDSISAIVSSHVSDATGNDWDLDALWADLKAIYPVGLEISEVLAEAGNRSKLTKDWLTRELLSDAKLAYEKRSKQIGDAGMRELERRVVLSVVDRKWREHLYEMDYLKEGIGLRAMAQRDPLVEYQREGFGMFQEMMASIKEEVVKYMFNVEVEVTAAPTIDPSKLTYTAPNEDGAPEAHTAKETRTNQNRVNPQAAQAPGQQQAKPANGKGSSFFKS
jgi:preprotein translocase subunit SecA